MTDNEITIKALKKVLELMLCEGDLQRVSTVSHAIDLINRQKAEIERLQKHIQEGIDLAKQIPEMIALAQAEAIKEFAERLKDTKFKHGNDYMIYAENIDNLVKEMVGDGG